VLRDVEATLIWDFGGPPGSRSSLYQASLAYRGLAPFVFMGGVFKSHFSLEEMQSSSDTLFLERAAIVSAASGLAAGSGRIGLQMHASGERWLASVAATGGETGPGSDSSQRGAAARLAGLPLRREGLMLHLGISGAVSWRPPSVNGVATVGLSARPELAVDRWSSPIDTGGIPARGAHTAGVEAGLGLGQLWLQGEAYAITVERAGQRGGSLDFSGWYASAAYAVLGQSRSWKPATASWGAPKPSGDGFSPRQGNWGALEVGARFSTLDLSDAEVRGGRQRVWTAGVNWWPVEPVRITLQFQHVSLRGSAEDRTFQAVALRGQLRF
jgi:phosphate-selective porin OprO/OprP